MHHDETAIVHRFNDAASPHDLAELLRNPSPGEARALIEYLGDARFERLRALAFTVGEDRGLEATDNRNVVVLPGIMGSELSVGGGDNSYTLWLNLLRIASVGLSKLQLDATGTKPSDGVSQISATGLLLKYYGEILLVLGRHWNVHAFPYDWRQDLETQSIVLHKFIREKFAGQSVNIVAHSMGGLVARSLWKAAPKTDSGEPLLRRLIMLGTPNFGSFEVPLIFAGIQDTVQKLMMMTHPLLSVVNQNEGRRRLLAIVSSFPGIYQMLPQKGPGAQHLAKSATYQQVNNAVNQSHLTRGIEFLNGLSTTIDPDRMVYVAGYGIETIVGVDTDSRLDQLDSYWASDAGDGKVSHELGLLPGVPTYYVHENHGNLPANNLVLKALDQLLEGKKSSLPTEIPESRGHERHRRPTPRIEKEEFDFRTRAKDWMDRIKGARGDTPRLVDPEEVRLEDEILNSWVAQKSEESSAGDNTGDRSGQTGMEPLSLKIQLVWGDISDLGLINELSPPVDAIAVGIYENQRRSWAAIRSIDHSIDRESGTEENPGLLGDLIGRGMVQGHLAVPTLIPDPRKSDGGAESRDIILIGMGAAGQFGAGEARQTSRELAWYSGRIGKKHLATVLIGAGLGNLSTDVAMREALAGIASALNDSRNDSRRDHTLPDRLQALTFVEYTPARVRALQDALLRHKSEIEKQFEKTPVHFDYTPLSDDELQRMDEQAIRKASEEQRTRIQTEVDAEQKNPPANRIIVEQVADSFWFSAMTNTASIPQRQVEIDPRIVDEQNKNLVASNERLQQIDAGRILGRLLIHRDFRPLFASAVPIVMDVDTVTARIHWELIVHENPDSPNAHPNDDPAFLASQRGFTRQLRTRFAPPPEPQPSASRILRALVVADPAPDASLAGAQREGIEVTEILRGFNQAKPGKNRVEVVSLIGPSAATRLRVLSELLVGQYDIVHFAGHCYFDEKSPQTCGWLFRCGNSPADREVLSARELRLVDRVPRFIFSNACESGVMPFRPEDRQSGCAPAFAETFFERGVCNFICTGWPVNDRAARLFARVFYSRMLGLPLDNEDEESKSSDLKSTSNPATLVEAMTDARKAVMKSGSGLRTWGAYQHYGNPYSQFFLSPGERPEGGAPATPSGVNVPPVSPARPADPSVSTAGDSAAFDAIKKIIAQRGVELGSGDPDVIDVRPGYQFVDDWITSQPAIIVVAVGDVDAVRLRVPAKLDGFPVDVWPADPLEQVHHNPSLLATSPQIRSREFLAPGDTPEVDDQTRALTAYVPPDDVSLDAVEEHMTLTCHVSPDCGFPVLSDFLDAVQNSLVVAMYDFTAPHILDRMRAAIRPRDRQSMLVLDPQLALGDGGSEDAPKSNDIDEDEARDTLKKAAGSRFQFVWAAVTRKGKVHDGIFPKAYHIKVAVRDKNAFWLSSGNWQSSNQPPLNVVPREQNEQIEFGTVLHNYNREWHVVIENPTLAKVFEDYIRWDYKQAEPLQDEERSLDLVTWPELLEPVAEEDRKITDYQRHPIKSVSRNVIVQPVLTPDNYPAVVEKLIRSATKSIRFQNQYINIGKTIPSEFRDLLNALKDKCEDPNIDVKIILRNIGDVRKMLTALKTYGFDVANSDLFRLQKSTHTKGIIVDDQKVLLGSHNWSGPGTTRNRDASLLFDDPEVAAYYAEVFDHDWMHIARAKSLGDSTMPRVADSTRALTPEGYRRVPWGAFFEDADDF